MVLEINVLLSVQNEQIVKMIDDQKIANDYFDKLSKKIQLSYKFFEIIDNFMGAKKASKTLVLFQNDQNINQSGGKWIYYMILTCDKYKCDMSEIDFGSNLSLAMADRLIPPEEIRSKKSIWVFEDLGWFFDFNDSASVGLKYYPTKTQFDNVIAVNTSIFEKLMLPMRAIDLETKDQKMSVDKNNVVEFLIKLTQYKNNADLASNSEKLSMFWDGFAKELQSEYKNPNNLKLLIFNIYSFINSKSMQLYAQNDVIQALKDLNYNNNLKTNKEADYLAITRSNILDKSLDGHIIQKVNLKIDIDKDGKIKNSATVVVNNNNSSRVSDKAFSYFQFYISKNSNLITTSFPSVMGSSKQPTVDYEKHGFVLDGKLDTINTKTAYLVSDDVRVYEDRGFLIVGGWAITGSGNQKKIEVQWDPVYKIDGEENVYKLFVQKQPNVDYMLNLEIKYPSDINGDNVIMKNINVDKDRLIEIKLD